MYLGLDLGTSGLKALLVDEEHRPVAEATAPLSVSRPHPGWSEQDPAHWIGAAEAALAGLAAKASLADVRGIGLSGQQHGATCLDASHEVIRPAILWNDTRAHREAAELNAREDLRSLTGNIVFAGFTSPKLVWMARHEPEAFARVALVLLPKDFLRLWLTGEAVSDMSDASGTYWLDIAARAWGDELLAATHMSPAAMPRVVEGSDVSGTLRPAVAERFGLPAGIPVAGGGGDNAAAAVGMGVVEPGSAFLSLGTSGVVFAPSPGFRPAPDTAIHTFCHALPGRWHQMGVILAATDALEWFARLAGAGAADLTAGLGPLAPPGRALFLPYLGGERTPHNDAEVRAALLGIGHECDRAAVTRAVLEGVALAVRDCRDALASTGTTIERLTAVGGGSRSVYWLACVATALGVPVDVPAAGDYGAAFGAARLGMMAATGAGVEIATPPAIARTVEPDPSLAAAFDEAHARFRTAYGALKAVG